jgi:uncharacterized protein
MHLESIHLYPVKSCRGTTLDGASLDARGLRHDRRWMLVDDEGTFLSQRTLPRMALIEPRLAGSGLQVTAPGMPPLDVPDAASASTREVEVWGDRCAAVDAGPEAAEWFSTFMDVSCSLVRQTEDADRPVDPDYSGEREEAQVSFADGFPFLLATTASVSDLNARIEAETGRWGGMEIERFRPNLVVGGAEPWEEDGWARLRIGAVEFAVVKPCARCVVITVDPATGEKGKDPLRTLATFRKRDGKVFFGQNLVHLGTGALRVGDPVEVLERRRAPG